MKSTLKVLLALLISLMMMLCICGCSEKESPKDDADAAATTADTTADTAADGGADKAEETVVGEGSTSFKFTVTDDDGKDTVFTVKTDKTTVGEALQNAGLIDGEEGAYGLYVKSVKGIVADYDKDGKYWAFYVDGKYALTGVDKTDIEDGVSYAFKIEKS